MAPISRLRRCFAFGLALLAMACAVPISYYDATTYRNLTDLKVDATQLVASFDTKSVAGRRRADVAT